MEFSELWDRMQPTARKFRKTTPEDKERWIFKNRKHFPNVNYAIRQVHRILGITGYNKKLPIPTTRQSLERLDDYWEVMCKQLHYPFHPMAPYAKKQTLKRRGSHSKALNETKKQQRLTDMKNGVQSLKKSVNS